MVGILACGAYLAGSLDALLLEDDLAVREKRKPKHTICAPDGENKVQAMLSAVLSVPKSSELASSSARAAVRVVIDTLFACQD